MQTLAWLVVYCLSIDRTAGPIIAAWINILNHHYTGDTAVREYGEEIYRATYMNDL
jgi:hypothetical protein